MPSVRFGRFDFDPDTGALRREGVDVRLQPQPARALAMLVARPGELVGREELREAVWGSETNVDFDRGLNFCIAQVRSALGDSADSPRYIETVPKRGYRFIAPVSVPAPPEQSAGVPDLFVVADLVSDPRVADQRGRRTLMAVLGVLLLAVGAGGLLLSQSRRAAPVRVAVVPFDNETGSSAFDSIATGVADATVARLASPERLRHVAVIGNAAILRRPRSFRDLTAIGEELDAEFVVLAQVTQDGGRVRLIAHLIRVRDEAHVWANTFDREEFSLPVQAELAEAIAAAVVERLAGSSSRAPAS
jgi:DNA-binding winged helix-turn-helix (wHTH) protein/TolB-like protein